MDEKFLQGDEGEGRLTREQVLELLKAYPTNFAPYLRYQELRIRELPKNARGTLELTLEKAHICIEAGFYQGVVDDLEAAILQISNDGGIDPEDREAMLSQLYDKLEALSPLS